MDRITPDMHTLRGYKSARELLEVPSTWMSDFLWMDGCMFFSSIIWTRFPLTMMPLPRSNRLTEPTMPRNEHFKSSLAPPLLMLQLLSAGLRHRHRHRHRPPANQRLNELPLWPPPAAPPTSSTIARTSSPWFRLHRVRLLIMLSPSHGATVATSPTPLLQGRLFMADSPSNVRFSPRRHSRMVAVVVHVMVLCGEIIVSDCERIRVSASSRDALWSGFGTLSFGPSSSLSD